MAKTTDWIYGIHTLDTIIQRQAWRIKALYVAEQRQDKRLAALIAAANAAGIKVQTATKAQLQQWLGDVSHQGVAANCVPTPLYQEADLEQLLAANPAPLLLILDGVQDPHNLGACLRTADAGAIDLYTDGMPGLLDTGNPIRVEVAGCGYPCTACLCIVSILGEIHG